MIPPTHPGVLFKTKPVTERDFEIKMEPKTTEQVVQGGLGIIQDCEFSGKMARDMFMAQSLILMATLTEISLDIGYYDTKVPGYTEKWNGHNCYYVSTMETKSLSYVDTPKPNPHSVIHVSERQWNLARNNPHHLLNFPQEILDQILGFTLVIKNHNITPDVTLSNKRSSYKTSHSYTLDGKRYEPPDFYNSEDSDHPVPLSTIITKEHHDSEGAYFMLHKVYRPMIDATILRVCKVISLQGTTMLYEKNVFQFSMTQITTTACPVYLACGKVHKQSVAKKDFPRRRLDYSPNPYGYFPTAFRAIETQLSTYDLEDYLYHDHFI